MTRTALPSTPRHQEAGPARGVAGTTLLVAQVFVGLNAVYGGIGLVVNGLGMPTEWLERLPVDTWALPGVALLLTVAAPQLGAAWFVVRRDPRAAVVGIAAGAALVAWIAVQLLLLQRFFFLQPVIAGFGVAEMLLAWAWLRRSPGHASGRLRP